MTHDPDHSSEPPDPETWQAGPWQAGGSDQASSQPPAYGAPTYGPESLGGGAPSSYGYYGTPAYGAGQAPAYGTAGYVPPAYGGSAYGSAGYAPTAYGAGPGPATGAAPPGYGPPPYGTGPAPGYSFPVYDYGPPRPQVEVGEAWRWAWSRLVHNMVLVGGPLLLGAVIVLVSVLLAAMADSLERPLAEWVAGCVAVLALGAFLYLSVGTIHASLVAARGEKARLRDFVVFPNAWRAMVVLVACGILALLGVLLFFVGAFFAIYFCTFAVLIALDQNTSVLKSISLSFSMMRRGVREGMVPLFLVSRLAMGIIANVTIIGVIVTAPAGQLMEAHAYMRMVASAPAAPEQAGAEPPGQPGW